MKKDVMAKIEVLHILANQEREQGKQKEQQRIASTFSARNSLAENIRSKEQAEAFKRMLHTL
ncbi:MAG: hypothetical protein ACXVMS_09310 [Flavisolibacter sp.]